MKEVLGTVPKMKEVRGNGPRILDIVGPEDGHAPLSRMEHELIEKILKKKAEKALGSLERFQVQEGYLPAVQEEPHLLVQQHRGGRSGMMVLCTALAPSSCPRGPSS